MVDLFADESVDGQLVSALRNAGYRVTYIAEELPSIKDPEVLRYASQRNGILFTEDKDFGELVHLRQQEHAGVVLLRMNQLSAQDAIARTLMVLSAYGSTLNDAFTVITPARVRRRTGP